MKNARNIAIILALAAVIVAVPAGGDAAGLIGAILSLAIVALLAYFAGRFYRDHQLDLYGLGDVDRAILYVSLGVIVVILAASGRLTATAAGSVAEVAALVVCGGGLLRVYRNWQRY